jgi:hypothetical protein
LKLCWKYLAEKLINGEIGAASGLVHRLYDIQWANWYWLHKIWCVFYKLQF